MKKRIVLCVLMIVFVCAVSGEKDDSNVEFWPSVGIDFKPAKGLKVYLEKQLRYENKFTYMESDLSELGLRYRLNKLLDFRVNYRFVYRPNSNQNRNRLDANLYLNLRWNAFKISNRSRIQKEYIETLDHKDSELEFRNRLRLTFRMNKKIRPYFGGEIFIGLGEDADDQNKFRLTAGTDWKVRKRVTLTLFYHYQKFLESTKSKQSHIIGFKFNYSF